MPIIKFIEHNGTEHVVDEEVGRSLMQAAVDHCVPGIVADCGGSCSCGTCHCFVDEAWIGLLPVAEDDERSMVEGLLDVTPGSRLSCQVKITPELDGIVVRLPKSQF
ncbi:2Fe-2S iron-sulfur cluster-binding protein [Paraburkholderia sp. GAS32]|jgi:2Fe-2S ferredoxin|uniref:2Fe-2S iron-sulfur cluster-binding protein n=1 Tax=Paraburkholderia sp. GAS32 TaxID=3035129 RepID=UPI003D1D5B50